MQKLSSLFKFGDTLFNFIKINLLVLLGWLLGLVILGTFPAIVSALTLFDNAENNNFRTSHDNFRVVYKSVFVKSNIVGYGFYLVISLLLLNYKNSDRQFRYFLDCYHSTYI